MPYTVKGKCVYKKEDGSKVGCTNGSVDEYLAALYANAKESVKSDKLTIEDIANKFDKVYANVKENINEINKLKGGKADKLTIQDIANKFKTPISKIEAQIKKGLNVEMEHTNDKEKALEIVMDHLTECPDYYDRLTKMEKQAEKEINENTKSLIKNRLRESLNKRLFI